MQPLEAVFAPLFFVLMGMQVNLGTLAEPSALTAALVMTLAAVVGKAAAGWSAGAACDRLTVGLGMIPRGEEALLLICDRDCCTRRSDCLMIGLGHDRGSAFHSNSRRGPDR